MTERRIYTIGHSNHSPEALVGLLDGAGIEAVVDVRSVPWSRHVPHASRAPLAETLRQAGVAYEYLGAELGGRSTDPDVLGDGGRARYDLVVSTGLFREGLARLEETAVRMVVAILCAEEDPTSCHRRLLVGAQLLADGWDVVHLRGDGSQVPDADLGPHLAQAKLFED